MTFAILVVIEDPLLRDEIKQTIRDYFKEKGYKSVVHGAGNVEEAKSNIQMSGDGGYDLLVCHVHIPEDSKTPVNTAQKRGLLLLQELRSEGIGIPSVLIALDNKIFQEVQRLTNVGLIIDGTESMYEDLQELSCRFVLEKSSQSGAQGPEKLLKYGKVRIYLKPKGEPCISIMEGINFNFPATPDFLQIDMEEIADLIGRSRRIERLENESDWKDELRSIGKKILKELFVRNRKFYEKFNYLKGEVCDEENITICFDVEENIYPLVLEALLDERGDHRMLHSPLFRSVMTADQIRQRSDIRFFDSADKWPPINFLIVAADAAGNVVDANINCGRKFNLGPVPGVIEEVQIIHDYFLANKAAFNINDVEMVVPKQGRDFKDDLNRCLTNRTWDLIHYAGHTYLDPVSNTGYFFYPARKSPLPVKSDNFCHTLRHRNKTQMIYLSSCQSSGADFVLRLAQQLIPAIIGFRWPIDDDKATEYARLFYENLFAKKKPLPYAFLETRRETYEKYIDNRIWAAAMLIIQGG